MSRVDSCQHLDTGVPQPEGKDRAGSEWRTPRIPPVMGGSATGQEKLSCEWFWQGLPLGTGLQELTQAAQIEELKAAYIREERRVRQWITA